MSSKILIPLLSLSFLASSCNERSNSPKDESSQQKEETAEPNQPPAQPPVQPPAQPPAQPPVQPPAQPPVQPPAQPPAQPPVQPPAQPPVQPPAQPPVQPPAQPPAQPPVQPPVQPPAQPPVQPPVQPQLSSFKAIVYDRELIHVTEPGFNKNITWKCGGSKINNLVGYQEGENEETTNNRFAKRNCGISNLGNYIMIHGFEDENGKSHNDIEIENLTSNVDNISISIKKLNAMSDVLKENEKAYSHIIVENIPNFYKGDIKIKGSFIDPKGKKGEFNINLKIHTISREVYERWSKPETSLVVAEFEQPNFVYRVEGREATELYQWKCPDSMIRNLEGFIIGEKYEETILRKPTTGCGLVPHDGLIPYNWVNSNLIKDRIFIDKKPKYIEDVKLTYGYSIVQKLGADNILTSGIKLGKIPYGKLGFLRIPITITDIQDRDNTYEVVISPSQISEETLANWQYKND